MKGASGGSIDIDPGPLWQAEWHGSSAKHLYLKIP
jgi:hypothetical protein